MTRPRHPGIALLWHFRIGPEEDWVDVPWDNDGTECLVGLYSSAASAQDAVARLRGKPGFCDWPGGFRVCRDSRDQGGPSNVPMDAVWTHLPERNVRNTRMGYDMYHRDEWRNVTPK